MKRELLKRRFAEGIAGFEAAINRRKPALLAAAEKMVVE